MPTNNSIKKNTDNKQNEIMGLWRVLLPLLGHCGSVLAKAYANVMFDYY